MTNAVKYTRRGFVKVYAQDGALVVEDGRHRHLAGRAAPRVRARLHRAEWARRAAQLRPWAVPVPADYAKAGPCAAAGIGKRQWYTRCAYVSAGAACGGVTSFSADGRSGTHMCAAAAFFVCLWLPAACLQKRKPAAGRCKRTLWHCSLYAGIIKSRTGALPCHIRQARAQRKGDREYGFAAGRASEKDIHHTLWRAPGAGAERRFLFRAGRGVRGHHG